MVDQGASTTELIRCIESIVRAGTVLQVDHGSARCRVQSGGLATNWLPWISLRAGDIRHWSPPSAGEQCIVFSPGGNMAAAFVLAGVFSDAIAVNGNTGDVERTTYPDGAVVEYDHASHALQASLPAGGTADITVPDAVKVRCKTADVTASDSATVHSQQITLDAPKTIATGELLVQGLLTYASGMVGGGAGPGGAVAVINGPVEVRNGDITLPGNDVIARGVSLANHQHDGVAKGGDLTGRPEA
jgi:phage baseplate assembly protein V